MNFNAIVIGLFLILMVSSILLFLLIKPLSQPHELSDGYYKDMLEKTKMFVKIIGIICVIVMVITFFVAVKIVGV